jgi:hypothetical protein
MVTMALVLGFAAGLEKNKNRQETRVLTFTKTIMLILSIIFGLAAVVAAIVLFIVIYNSYRSIASAFKMDDAVLVWKGTDKVADGEVSTSIWSLVFPALISSIPLILVVPFIKSAFSNLKQRRAIDK